jgi:hypothetical protein
MGAFHGRKASDLHGLASSERALRSVFGEARETFAGRMLLPLQTWKFDPLARDLLRHHQRCLLLRGRKGDTMRAFLILTEREPKIVAMARDEASESRLVEVLTQAGIDQFVAHEIAVDALRENYGLQFEVIEEEVRNGKGLRVLDSNGRRVWAQVQLADIGPAVAYGF